MKKKEDSEITDIIRDFLDSDELKGVYARLNSKAEIEVVMHRITQEIN